MGSEARARVAAGALLVLTLFTFGQVFRDGDYAGPALLALVLSTLVVMGVRRVGLGLVASLAAWLLGLVWYLTVVFSSERTFYGLPTLDALAALAPPLRRAYAIVPVDYAPVPLRPGYVIMLVAGMWLAAGTAEIAAFRLRRPVLASLPAIGLFCVVMVVGTREAATFSVALFLSALLAFWGLEARHSLRSWGRSMSAWAHIQPRGAGATPVTGALARRMGAATVAVAVVSPLFLPALGDGLLSWRSGMGGDGNGSGGAINPLISIAPRLIRQTDDILLEVESDDPAYWRLLSLAEFDGEDWHPVGGRSSSSITGGTPAATPLVGDVTKVVGQHYDITGLEGRWLPAATQATRIDISESADHDVEEQDLIVDSEGALLMPRDADVRGLRYFIESSVPDVDFGDLRRATVLSPGPDYTELPSGLSDEVVALAERWTRGERTVHEKLVAIQDRLRSFEYSLEVEPTATADHLATFLMETRKGYCQQFATAFAILARSLDIPTRVSVGFLPGQQDLANPDHFVVRGTDAHAWPEVYFAEYGWVAYEPTPRETTALPAYTVAPLPGSDPGEVPRGVDALSSGSQNPVGRFAQDPRERGNLAEIGGLRGGNAAVARPDPDADAVWEAAFRRVLTALASALAAFLIVVPLLKTARAARRYRRAPDPNATTAAAFAHFIDDASELATERLAAETATAFALRVARDAGVPERSALRLASLYEAAQYARDGIGEREAGEARTLAARLRAELWRAASWWRRGNRLFSPRGILPARR